MESDEVDARAAQVLMVERRIIAGAREIASIVNDYGCVSAALSRRDRCAFIAASAYNAGVLNDEQFRGLIEIIKRALSGGFEKPSNESKEPPPAANVSRPGVSPSALSPSGASPSG